MKRDTPLAATPGATPGMAPRSCDALGVCQAGSGCPGPCRRYPFAPGAIQGYAPRRPRRLARWALLALECAAALALVLLLGVASGYLHAKGWL